MSSFLSVLFIAGPTAVGKSAVALRLAEDLHGEIICCDSMQVYREVSIASNKPGSAERARVPHHLFDKISVYSTYDVAQYYHQARAVISEVMARGRLPVVVGGSGLYMQVLIDGIFEDRSTDERVRSELEARADDEGLTSLYEELKARDPRCAEKIHHHDRKRIIRALEAGRVSGEPFSELQKKRQGLWGQYPVRVIVLNRDRKALYAIIDRRVEDMFREGLVEEIRRLDEAALSSTARYLIGVREVGDYLRGVLTLEAARAAMQQNTRRYAKRQLTWFRKDSRWEWLVIEDEDSVERVARRVKETFEND